ncbi:MAG TPA: phosphoribosylglycinamide formyltransferase [Chitinophagaceae bacterium]|nr:phosphoribosylglycinamide formyltransferase [Chitinophagaceae bacterium]
MSQIAIFASGAGSNAEKIIEYLAAPLSCRRGAGGEAIVSLIVCNKPEAGVLKIAEEKNIPTLLLDKEKFFRGNGYVDELKNSGIDLIVLAGFLWKLPASLVRAWHKKIVNIHPALLPKYGGKGMYGQFVHEAVLANKEKESGITIHYVDEVYDNGQIILQATCMIDESETAVTLAKKVRALEHRHFPPAVALLATL